MTFSLVDLAFLVSIAAVLSVIMRALKQPVIIAYLITGAIVGAYQLIPINDNGTLSLFSNLGIMFLLFLVGLEINYISLKTVGKASLVIGLGQIIFTSLIGYGIARLFDFAILSSLYIAIALTFSSTIIIVKLLSEKKELNSLYGKISIGFMLVQDVFAILILIGLGGIASGNGVEIFTIFITLIKGILVFGVVFFIGRKLIPYLFDRIARSNEIMFLLSLAWLFILVSLISKFGFTLEIGGFLAGLSLANSSEKYQIANRIRPLRDFFLLIFFIILGSSLTSLSVSGIGLPVIVFSLFVLVGNPLIVLAIMGFMGYKRRTGFLAGVTVAQISEFSLILASLGLRLGHIGQPTLALITWVGVITILTSTYLILHGDKIYVKIQRFLRIFEKKRASEPLLPPNNFNQRIFLIGGSRMGSIIMQHLLPSDVLVIDFDPLVVESVRKKQVVAVLGDASDTEILEEINIQNAEIVVSTCPTPADNFAIIDFIKKFHKRPKFIARATNVFDAKLLYKRGADYVIIATLTSGHYVGEIVSRASNHAQSLMHAREKDRELIKSL